MPTSSPTISTSTRCTPMPVFLRSVCFIETRLMSLGTSPRLFTSFMMGLLSAFSLFSVSECASGSWYALATRKMLCPWLATATSSMWQMSQYSKEERKWCCLIRYESQRKRGHRHWMSLASGLRMASSLRLPSAWQQRTCYLTTSYQQGYCLFGSLISKGTMSAWQSLRPVLLSTKMSLTYRVYLMAMCMSASTMWSTEEGRRVGSAKSMGQWYSLPTSSPSSRSPVDSSIWQRTLQPSRKYSPSFCSSSFMSSKVRVRTYSSNFLDYPISTLISSFCSDALRMSSVSRRGGEEEEWEELRPMFWMCEYPRSYTSTGALASQCFGVSRSAADRRGCWVCRSGGQAMRREAAGKSKALYRRSAYYYLIAGKNINQECALPLRSYSTTSLPHTTNHTLPARGQTNGHILLASIALMMNQSMRAAAATHRHTLQGDCSREEPEPMVSERIMLVKSSRQAAMSANMSVFTKYWSQQPRKSQKRISRYVSRGRKEE